MSFRSGGHPDKLFFGVFVNENKLTERLTNVSTKFVYLGIIQAYMVVR